ncbi:MAG: hypothetical protein HY076_09270, partial [Candidatus Eisenbacteria bacterium]|nr:hypothetical protein [Candidatus Eisenbacteria bacterium]
MRADPTRFLGEVGDDRPDASSRDFGRVSGPGGARLAEWLAEYARRPEHRGALAHWHTIPARAARHADLDPPLAPPLAEALAARGIARLYTHQAEAIASLRAGRDVVVVTGTASGKSLCYH